MTDAYGLAAEFEEQARWRFETSNEFPDDRRNHDACKTWELLAAAAKAGDFDPEVLASYDQLWVGDEADLLLLEARGQLYREVGFHFFPKTVNELLREVISRATLGRTSAAA